MAKIAAGYSEKDIERFAGLAGIRKKPTVYVGPMDSNGLWTIFREPADNAVDQALAGRNKLVHLIMDSEPNTYWVLDGGEGIPVGVKVFEDERGRKEKLSTFFVATGLTHAGANFAGDSISRGTHGIGIKATNALSKLFKVWTFRDGKWWVIEYKSGKHTDGPKKAKAPKLPHGIKAEKGTIVCFKPELDLFGAGAKIKIDEVREWCQLTSYLVPKLKVKLTNAKGKTKTWDNKDGPAKFIDAKVEELKCDVTGKSFVFSSREIDAVIAFSNAEGNGLVQAYTNGLRNSMGGQHLEAVQDTLFKSLKPYTGKATFTPSDLREGLIGLVNYKIAAPQFNNQTKDKLVDIRVYDIAAPQLLKAWEDFWKKNKSMAKQVIATAVALRARTNDFLKDKRLIKNVKNAKKTLSTKLAGVQGNIAVGERELFLVEGDSAGGTAKRARDKSYQAVFPLRGKPLNVMEATKEKTNANVEISTLLAALGLDLGSDNPLKKLQYGKLIFLADADVDGAHITTLLMALVYKYIPDMFKQGKVYYARVPEYKAFHKGNTHFGFTKKGLYKSTGTDKVSVTHLKGLGELEPEELREVAMSKKTRRLVQLISPKDKNERKQFERLMGKDPTFRKELLGIL